MWIWWNFHVYLSLAPSRFVNIFMWICFNLCMDLSLVSIIFVSPGHPNLQGGLGTQFSDQVRPRKYVYGRASYREPGPSQGARASHREAGPLTGRPGLSQGGRASHRDPRPLTGRSGISQGGRASYRKAWPLTRRLGLTTCQIITSKLAKKAKKNYFFQNY